MAHKTLFDIGCENFDLFFARTIEKMSPEAKETLPRDISFRLFRRGGAWNATSTNKLGFLAKMFVLIRALRKRFILLIEDEEGGIGLEQFMRMKKEREFSVQAAEGLRLDGAFVLGNKELMDYFHYLNQLSVSPAYNFLTRMKNLPPNRADQSDKEMAYIFRFLSFWDGNKRSMVANTGLNMPEIYVLLYLYPGKEVSGSDIYNDKFKRAYQSTPSKIKLAFSTLFNKGYITKYGQTRGMTIQITSTGKAVIREIVMKYAVNC